MGLIGNYSVLAKHPGRDIGGGATGLGYNPGDFGKVSQSRGRYAGMAAWEPKSGVPDGYRPPYTWVLPQKPGSLGSRNIITGTGTFQGSGAMGVNGAATIAGSGSLSATGALIVSAIASLAGTGSISTADLLAVLQATATLSGSGTLAGTADALGWVLASMTGTGTLTGTRYATGALEADITPFTTLSPENLALAVWSAVAADNNDTGTMGEKVNDAGSASNPWTEVIEGSYTAAEMLRIIAAALAGELAGAGTTTITIQGIDATTDRIVATVDGTGNRTAVTLDGA